MHKWETFSVGKISKVSITDLMSDAGEQEKRRKSLDKLQRGKKLGLFESFRMRNSPEIIRKAKKIDLEVLGIKKKEYQSK
jgi:hypothetical protein